MQTKILNLLVNNFIAYYTLVGQYGTCHIIIYGLIYIALEQNNFHSLLIKCFDIVLFD